MKYEYEYLKDSNFLKTFDSQIIKECFAKITILDWDENPIQDIQGIVVDGNINLDGSSAMRRTCNISVYIHEEEYSGITNLESLFSLNKKVSIEIGYINTTDQYKEYPKIYFPQGIYVIIDPSITHDMNGSIINLQLKDKMCLLNGEIGGVIPATAQFDEYDTLDSDGRIVTEKPIIIKIITELVNHFGGENLARIIVSDIESRIKQVMKWTGSTPLYLIKASDGNYLFTTNESQTIGKDKQTFDTGRDVGYIYTDFYYPYELIGDSGTTVCEILDEIKNTLGNFEYFYDIEGNFIFQEIKNYLNTSQAKIEINKIENNNYLVDTANGKTVYDFDNSNLITSYSNSPQYSKIKNDFVVWGKKKKLNGNSVSIRYHLAIDKKPQVGKIHKVVFWEDPEDSLMKAKVPLEFSSISTFPVKGFPGTLYLDKSTNKIYVWDITLKIPAYTLVTSPLQTIATKDWRDELYLSGAKTEATGLYSNYYYTELSTEWPKLYDSQAGKYYDYVLDTPSDIDFFLDFIDASSKVGDFSVSNIGRRTKVIVDDSINCIFEPEIPDFILIETGVNGGDRDTAALRTEAQKKGQQYIQVDPNIYAMLAIGGTKNSAYEAIKQLLHEYTSYNESISIQCLPIYYLEPNTRISVRDIESDIHGDYMISSISIPLGVDATMSISATRALERF